MSESTVRHYDNRIPREEATALVGRVINRSALRYSKADFGLTEDAPLNGNYTVVAVWRQWTNTSSGRPWSETVWGVKVNGQPAGHVVTSRAGRSKFMPYGYGGFDAREIDDVTDQHTAPAASGTPEFVTRIEWSAADGAFAAGFLRDGQPWILGGALVGMGRTRDEAVADLASIAQYLVVHGLNYLTSGPLPLADREWLFAVLDCGNDAARVEMYDAMAAARGGKPELIVVQPSPQMLAHVADLDARVRRIRGDGDDLDS